VPREELHSLSLSLSLSVRSCAWGCADYQRSTIPAKSASAFLGVISNSNAVLVKVSKQLELEMESLQTQSASRFRGISLVKAVSCHQRHTNRAVTAGLANRTNVHSRQICQMIVTEMMELGARWRDSRPETSKFENVCEMLILRSCGFASNSV
jgi:hypothetical protein